MHTNALIGEKSPYLLQHAHNPVDWLPWGEEAFARARTEDKPIFLSIGYSTCHWCHVMERESFEDEETARVLNRYFVAIKVDREERPDIDRVYMTFVQATTGSGGWPLSVFLTPELRPFFGGTYFPPQARYGQPGFRELLERVAEAWRFDRARILESSAEVMRQLGRAAEGAPSAIVPSESALDGGFQAFRRSFDPRQGGFGSAPKFPRPSVHNFLLRYWARTKNAEALEMVLATLKAMARGGIHDHLGGGFHRYSVDERWFVPHFEKMLYDQAQLAASYLEAYQISRDRHYADVARDILDYVLRDMTHPDGGFYSAEDADSTDPSQPEVKREGAFYLWTRQEIEDLLGGAAAERFCRHYGVEERGNVRGDPHGEFGGKNILYESNADEEERRSLEEPARMLLEARSRRPRPHLDDKILTGWNGLMISALAKGAQVLEDERYREAARRAAEFLLRHMYSSERGTLLRRYRDSEAAIAGFLEDYAFFVQALLDLYETVFDVGYLELSARLTDTQLAQFQDQGRGGFYSTAADDGGLLLRMKDEYDGAEPSGNSIAALNLLRLADITGRESYREAAEGALRSFGPSLTAAPAAAPQMLASLAYQAGRPQQIVLAGERSAADTRAFLRAVRQPFLPNKTVLLVDGEGARQFLSAYSPAFTGMGGVNGAATAYVCEGYACRLRATELEQFEQLLEG